MRLSRTGLLPDWQVAKNPTQTSKGTNTCSRLNYTIIYNIILYYCNYTVLYYTILYYTVLYYTLHYTRLDWTRPD